MLDPMRGVRDQDGDGSKKKTGFMMERQPKLEFRSLV